MSKRDETEDDRHSPEFKERIHNGMAAKTVVIPERQIEEIAMRAARAGVREGIIEMWRQLGIKIDDADGIRLFTEDLINLRNYSQSLDKRKEALTNTVTEAVLSVVKWICGVGGLYVLHLIYLDLHR